MWAWRAGRRAYFGREEGAARLTDSRNLGMLLIENNTAGPAGKADKDGRVYPRSDHSGGRDRQRIYRQGDPQSQRRLDHQISTKPRDRSLGFSIILFYISIILLPV